MIMIIVNNEHKKNMFSPPIGNRYAWFDDVGLVHATKSCRLPRPVSSPKLPAKGGHGTTGKKKSMAKSAPPTKSMQNHGYSIGTPFDTNC